MGYTRQDGRFARGEDITPMPAGSKTVTTNGAPIEVGDATVFRGFLDVTARTGTSPTLDVTIETSHDGVNNWRLVGAFAQKTNVGSERKVFAGLDRFIRAVATLGGTSPNFTFGVTGELV
jgi:hypothetical protein